MGEPRRLRLLLEPTPETIHEPDFVSDVPSVSFEAFLADHRVFGWVRLDAERVSDMLNMHDVLHLDNARIESLTDGATRAVEELVVTRAELAAVRAGSPRGDAARRRRTRTHPICVESGRYLIGGYVHALPGVGPELRIRSGDPMVPLTDAWIEYWLDGELRRQWVGTIVFNRLLADRIDQVADWELEHGLLKPLGPGLRRPRA